MSEDVVEKIDLLDVLLDHENKEPIQMMDEKGKVLEFEQVAIIPYKKQLYCILKPISEIKGVADDEAIVFRVCENEEGESIIRVEENEAVAMKIFMEYYDLLEESL